MLDIKFIRENAELVEKNCKNRRVKADIGRLIEIDGQRRANLQEIEQLRGQRRQKSKQKPSTEEINLLKKVGDRVKELEEREAEIERDWQELMLRVPNMTHPDAPIGGEEDFKVIETRGQRAKFEFKLKNHEEILTDLGLIDFERGAKVAGAKFYFTKGNLARLNFALIQYGMDVVSKHGYEPMETPDAVKSEILEGSGFNPRGGESQIYRIEGHDLNLIGTAEISVLGYHANEVLDISKGPIKYAALSHCFRTEAGAYGKESRGLYRVHQFTKLEMFVFCQPEQSEAMHQELLSIEKQICDGLEIPYRVIDIASGDLGGPAYRKYDIEAWMPGKDGYGEITSTSDCTDYQARRLNIKFKKPDGKSEFAHTLNGTAIVLSRFPIAIVENNQQADGSVEIPKVLQKYLGIKKLQ